MYNLHRACYAFTRLIILSLSYVDPLYDLVIVAPHGSLLSSLHIWCPCFASLIVLLHVQVAAVTLDSIFVYLLRSRRALRLFAAVCLTVTLLAFLAVAPLTYGTPCNDSWKRQLSKFLPPAPLVTPSWPSAPAHVS